MAKVPTEVPPAVVAAGFLFTYASPRIKRAAKRLGMTPRWVGWIGDTVYLWNSRRVVRLEAWEVDDEGS